MSTNSRTLANIPTGNEKYPAIPSDIFRLNIKSYVTALLTPAGPIPARDEYIRATTKINK